MKAMYQKPESLTSDVTTYCPGCGHGIIQKLIAEVIDELGVREKTIGIAPVGCAVLSYNFFNFDVTEAAHGRAPAVATAIKRLFPTRIVFTYQGDGDLAAIGTAEIVHAAARGENFSVVFVNNAVYGMTKGQMAPTTLIGQKTTTTTDGRTPQSHGFPIKVCELLLSLDGVTYLERTTISDIPGILATKRAIKKAFLWQMKNKGMGFVEVLSTCPVNWKKSPSESMKWMKETMEKYYPVKIFKDPGISI
ncbi:MAG TPA: thiamine pyrophosphate-dependent enzyme [bacterium]|nr:thiamine pyrophosphate-dependent enzyme [bacterium]HOL49742.1 thiamine pyrophosphate-dependent enzyme [bacterium]HPO52503.1 thiamine pyrophosphate-dependent enzyme [bacterium]HXK44871.1 thiamine pyrophosphate-dependent enzyme [bacterium]